jgi:DNA-binding IclR family transcriptional regulator
VGQSSGVGVLDKAVLVLDSAAHAPLGLGDLVAATGLPRATAAELAQSAPDPLLAAAGPVLAKLRDRSGESAQLYRRSGDERVCVAAAERASGLRTTVMVGARMPLTAGSGAQVLMAWSSPDDQAAMLASARYGARTLAEVRRRGWAFSVAQREAGVASVSGPVERLGRRPGPRFAPLVTAAATALSSRL